MPTMTIHGESGTPASTDPAPRNLVRDPGSVAVTADPGLPSTRRMPPVLPPMVLAPAARMAARECGLGGGDDAPRGTWCRDFLPELMVELI